MNLIHSRDVVITIFAPFTSNFEVKAFLRQSDLTFLNKFLKSEAKKLTILISELWVGLNFLSDISLSFTKLVVIWWGTRDAMAMLDQEKTRTRPPV